MVEARRGGGMKKAQQWTEGSETGTKKIGRNCKKKNLKKYKNRQKSNTPKHQNKTEMEEAGEEKKGQGHQV
jgi:hypothetical protein